MRNVLCAAFCAVAMASLSLAATAPAAAQVTHDPARVRAGSYAVDPDHTQIVFGISHLGMTPYYGQFSQISGSLDLSPAEPAKSRLTVTLPVASVYTTSPVLTGMLAGPDWFDAARSPEARFVSTSVTPTGADSATIIGDLTLHGVTRPVTLSAKFVGAGPNAVDGSYNAGFSATGVIKRSEFGVDKYIPLVGDEVTLTIAGAFARKG